MSNSASSAIPAIDKEAPRKVETATFAMGCFWSPDALFGTVKGVVRTRVGYAGGTTEDPTYWTLTDHIESLQVDYDPTVISYQELLQIFFASHNVTREPWKRQYMSAIFYHGEEQQKQAYIEKEKAEANFGKQVYTEVYPLEKFYLAEDRHQKYKLQRQQEIMEEFKEMYPKMAAFVDSTAAARVNGYLYGYGKAEELNREISSLGLSAATQKRLLSEVSRAVK